jgi:ABC-type branched-subunit amino acid transport system ATPase component
MLKVNSISKGFGGVQALSELSFELQPGRMLALIGPNGAGKSTCFNVINGQLKPDGGSVQLDQQRIDGLGPEAIFRLGVGRTFQVAATFSSMTVIENVQMALLSKAGRLRHFWKAARDQMLEPSRLALEQVGLMDQANRPASNLAYADLKRLELSIAMVGAPKLLLMDEPTAGMAPNERLGLMALTQRIARENNTAVLFTEHSMDAVFKYADQVLVLARGKLIAQGSVAQIRADPKVQAVYLGVSHVQ